MDVQLLPTATAQSAGKFLRLAPIRQQLILSRITERILGLLQSH